jgi:hypothetical protein
MVLGLDGPLPRTNLLTTPGAHQTPRELLAGEAEFIRLDGKRSSNLRKNSVDSALIRWVKEVPSEQAVDDLVDHTHVGVKPATVAELWLTRARVIAPSDLMEEVLVFLVEALEVIPPLVLLQANVGHDPGFVVGVIGIVLKRDSLEEIFLAAMEEEGPDGGV